MRTVDGNDYLVLFLTIFRLGSLVVGSCRSALMSFSLEFVGDYCILRIHGLRECDIFSTEYRE